MRLIGGPSLREPSVRQAVEMVRDRKPRGSAVNRGCESGRKRRRSGPREGTRD